MYIIGFGKNVCFLLNNRIYKKTNCTVKIGVYNFFFDFTKGVRQGCSLSRILVNLDVNDIFRIMNQNNISNICLNGTPINSQTI